MIYFLFPMSLICAFFLTGLFRLIALRVSIVDVPNHRSSHEVPTPRGGGIAITCTFFIGSFILALFNLIEGGQFLLLLCCSSAIAVVGFIDDCRPVPALTRFIVHVVVSSITIWFLYQTNFMVSRSGIFTLSWLFLPIITFILVWLINLYNFMDGIDGIAGVEAVTVFFGAATILWLNGGNHGHIQWLLILSAAILGFLVKNWPPAKIFMGDSGSGFLGFVLGYFTIITSVHAEINLWSWLILGGVFVTDATVTLLRRLIKGERIFEAHRSHSYQILAQRYNSHRKITLGVLLVNVLWLFPFAFMAAIYPNHAPIITLVSLLPVISLCLIVGYTKGK